MNLRLEELYRRHLPLHDDEIVGYYDTGLGYSKPERSAEAEQESFAICLATTDDEVFYAGDHDRPFALQPLSKVFVYGLALEAHGCDRVLVRVGVEPSGDAFNSIDFDEHNNRLDNPMVNAGARDNRTRRGRKHRSSRARRHPKHGWRYAGNERFEVDEDIFEAEMRTADLNWATAYLMRSDGMLTGDAETTLALYLRQCSSSKSGSG